MKTYFRLFVALTTILFASLVTALSCDKDGEQPTENLAMVTNVTNVTNMITVVTNVAISNISNTNITSTTNISNTNIYEGSPTPVRIAEPAGFENFVIVANSEYAKLEGGAIYVNVKELAEVIGPAVSSRNAATRGAGDLAAIADAGGTNVPSIFSVAIKGSTGGIMLVQPYSVTKDTLAYTTAATTFGNPPQLETGPVTTATYRTYEFNLFGPDVGPHVWNVFGDFASSDSDYADGVFYCRAYLSDSGVDNQNGPLTGGQAMDCRFASVNDGTFPAAEVNEAWLTASGAITELDVKLFGIDTGNKNIPNLGAPSITSGIDFGQPVSNAVMKQIMNANKYYESELKIKLVSEEDF